MADTQATPVDATPVADASVAVSKKAPKRFWYLVDAAGERVERDGKMPKIHGKNPFQAVQKAVTKYAPEGGAECEFFLREVNAKPTKAGKVRVYQYKGWKTLLSEEEKSEFTNNMSITSKPHAKSVGHTLIDAPPPKKRTRKPKSDEAEAKDVKKAKKTSAGKGKAATEVPDAVTSCAAPKKAGKGKGKGKAAAGAPAE